MQKKASADGLTADDIAELPVDQKQVMEFLMKDPMTSMQGITLDLLQAKLSQIAGIPDIITLLVKENWLLTLGTAPAVRYKVNYKRKRTRLSVKI